nr:hypothetical protein [Tanacetum cinerariifolium]
MCSCMGCCNWEFFSLNSHRWCSGWSILLRQIHGEIIGLLLGPDQALKSAATASTVEGLTDGGGYVAAY